MKKKIFVSTYPEVEMGIQLEIVKEAKGNKYLDRRIALEDGTWLYSYGDGRYCTDGDEQENWAAVLMGTFDEDGELEEEELLGYTRI